MMKRLLALILCILMISSAAFAETADTLPKKFVRQLTGGNGVRGYVSITASGVAEWLDLLLPFTATDIQIRAIGEKQGEMSDTVTDDDDWQVRFYAKNSDDKEVGTTWLYGDPSGVYFQSELLPGSVLSVPVADVNLLYQLLRGDYHDLFFAFDPLAMKEPGAQGNAAAYEAVAGLLGVPEEEWTTDWAPVLEKYFQHLDLWLAGYGDSSILTGDTGALTMSANYTIPANEFKQQAKYVIGQMLYDHELQNLLLPYVSMEQRVTYLNPGMVYFYEACIDALPLNGDIILSREMSARGEIVSAKVSLPIPELPRKLTQPVEKAAKAIFGLPYEDVLSGMERIEFIQNGDEKAIVLTGDEYTVSVTALVSNPDEVTTAMDGSICVTPSDPKEAAMMAAFTCQLSHRIWQDEKYLDHDTSTFNLAIEPAAVQTDDASSLEKYIDIKPVSVNWSVDYRNNPYQENSAVQINYDLDAKLPDAAVQAAAVLRITTQMKLEALSTNDAKVISARTDEQKQALIDTFVSNAVLLMANLNGEPIEAAASAEEPTAEPTSVPPMNE